MTAVGWIWKYLAGTESGTCGWINDIVPDTAARRLREAE
jgi:galactose-1-phosphate uridylyltransferase